MITKTISNIQPEQMQYVLSNLAKGFVLVDQSQTSVTATGPQKYWDVISLPSSATLTTH